MRLDLDRMEIEDAGRGDPARLAAAIHSQLGEGNGSVPVREIALALDIDEIRKADLTSIEAALITTAERDRGAIVVNGQSNHQRRRFSIGHELLHFLNPLHVQTDDGRFECRKADMALGTSLKRTGLSIHDRQEIEANRFSIELMAPLQRMKPFLRGLPDLEQVLHAAEHLDISKQATARRYIELRPEPLAIVVSKNTVVTYSDWNEGFPMLLLAKGARLPRSGVRPAAAADLSSMDEVDPSSWLRYPDHCGELFAQHLYQSNGHGLTLLLAELEPVEAEE